MSLVGVTGKMGMAARVIMCAMMIALAASNGWAAWSHNVAGGFDVWSLGTAQKFRYDLDKHQWGHYSNADSKWYTLTGTGASATFIGNGGLHLLGNGFSYAYGAAGDNGFFKKGGTANRFYYNYTTGRWFSAGNAGGWQLLGNPGLSASLLGDGSWHDLKNGFKYIYLTSGDFGVYQKAGKDRFAYYYTPARWTGRGSAGGWQNLGSDGVSSAFMGDGSWHDLKNGFKYLYNGTADVGWFAKGNIGRFGYHYAAARWVNTGNQGGWQLLGDPGLSASLLGDGSWHDLKNGFTYIYLINGDFGVYQKGAKDRFAYYYSTGQWKDSYIQRNWMNLGKDGLSSAFIGDGQYRSLGQGFDYKYSAEQGYFRYDDFHHFRQSYADGSWQYEAQPGVWSPWAAATPVQNIGAQAGDGALNPYIAYGSNMLFIAQLDGSKNLYRYDGRTLTNVSNGSWTEMKYAGASGTRLMFTVKDNAGYDLYAWNGTTFSDVSGNSDFVSLDYLASSGSDLFFDARTTTHDLWRWNGAANTFAAVPGDSNFGGLSYLASSGSDLFFSVWMGGYTDLWRWNGSTNTFAAVPGGCFLFIAFETAFNNDIFFSAEYYQWYDWTVWRWNGTTATLTDVMSNLSYIATSGEDVFFEYYARISQLMAPMAIYLWKESTASFELVPDTTAYYLRYLGLSGTNLFFSAREDVSGTDGVYRLNVTTRTFSAVQGGGNLSYLSSLGSCAGDMFLSALWRKYGRIFGAFLYLLRRPGGVG